MSLEDLKALAEEVKKVDIEKAWRDYSANVKLDLERIRLTGERSGNLRQARYLTAA